MKKTFVSLMLIVALLIGLLCSNVVFAAQILPYNPPENIPLLGKELYDIGDEVPREVVKAALDAVNKERADGGMLGVPYSDIIDANGDTVLGFDCSSFVEAFLRNYVGYKKSSMQYYTAQNFYLAFKAAGDLEAIPKTVLTEISNKNGSNVAQARIDLNTYLVESGIRPGAVNKGT